MKKQIDTKSLFGQSNPQLAELQYKQRTHLNLDSEILSLKSQILSLKS